MKICIAQTKSLKGKVQENIKNHLQIIDSAISLNADLIIFPELSITNYEPSLAKDLATTIENSIFDPFQELSDKGNISIGVGMPTKTAKGIYISMLLFQPDKKRVVYSKQILHSDEYPFFINGNEQTFINIKGHKIAVGICYETLQMEHFLNATKNGANLYIASVAKSKSGIEKAYSHFPKMAAEFKTPVLLSNCVGYCDNFLSHGHSAVWNKNGKLTGQLDAENQGILIYDTNSELYPNESGLGKFSNFIFLAYKAKNASIALAMASIFNEVGRKKKKIKSPNYFRLGITTAHQIQIEKGKLSELDKLIQIYFNGKNELERHGIYQWTNNYPTPSIIESDLQKGVLYTLKNGPEIIGAINLSEEQEPEYQSVN